MAEPPPAEPDPTLDPAALNAAISSLAPALEILERFHHRNKNQHRLSKWWAQADMLRRHTRKMLACLESGAGEAERLARAASAKDRKKKKEKKEKEKLKGRKEAGGGGNAEVRKRAGYLRWKLGPGAYLAFTQLCADRQFAHLGLMLLGVLAQVDRALAPFAPDAPSPPPTEAAAADWTAAAGSQQQARSGATTPRPGVDLIISSSSNLPGASTGPYGAGNPLGATEAGPVDTGVAVSRDEVMRSIEQAEAAPDMDLDLNPTLNTPEAIPWPQAAGRGAGARSEPPPRHRALSVAVQEEIRKESSSPGPTEANSGLGRLKKEKKKKRADEFDDIFGALDKDRSSSSSKPKKKKRKKDDEFDDIFGGLL